MLKRGFRCAITVLAVALIFHHQLPSAECQLLDYLSDLSPTSIIDKFRKLIGKSVDQIDSEIQKHKEYIAQLEDLKVFADKQDTWLEELSSSYAAMFKDLPKMYQKVKDVSQGVVSRLKETYKIRDSMDGLHKASVVAADEMLTQIREVMKLFMAPEEDLPPTASEYLETQRSTVNDGDGSETCSEDSCSKELPLPESDANL